MKFSLEERAEVLDATLNLYWLRPENALWYAYDIPVVRHLLGPHAQPSLDLGCGDGLVSFLMRGGRFGEDFDAYCSVHLKSEQAWVWENLPQDDYFDHFEERAFSAPSISRAPEHRYTYGVDWKDTLLRKAAALSLYDHLVQHDANTPLRRFADGQFRTIFSNILYWVDNLDGLLRELARVLAPGGRLVVTCPDASIGEVMVYRYQRDHGLAWIKDVDRGRALSWVHALPESGWRVRFAAAGLEVEEHVGYIPDLVFRVNDIGLRPLFPVLMTIYDVLRRRVPDEFLAVKRRWIANCRHFLQPLLDESWMEPFEMGRHWHAFRLTHRGGSA